jgi:hypothetical protein
MQKNKFLEGLLAALVMVLAFLAIREFFRNDRNQLVSARGKQVLNDEKLMRRVRKEMERHEKDGISGPVVVNLH